MGTLVVLAATAVMASSLPSHSSISLSITTDHTITTLAGTRRVLPPPWTTHPFSSFVSIRGGAEAEIEDPSASSDIGCTRKQRQGKSSKRSSKTELNLEEMAQKKVECDDVDSGGAEETNAENAISEAMKVKDVATIIGNAIRDRADILLQDELPYYERSFDSALISLGLALGTAGTDKKKESDLLENDDALAYYQYGHRDSHDLHSNQKHRQQQSFERDRLTILSNYFLKTHGGAHGIQCILSLLASSLGLVCLLLPSFPPAVLTSTGSKTSPQLPNAQKLSRQILLAATKYELLKQTLVLAMAKHTAGLLGAVILGASKIPQSGLRNIRRQLEMIALDPIGQYLFYCALLVVWMGSFGGGSCGSMSKFIFSLKGNVISIMNASVTKEDKTATTGSTSQSDTTVTELLNTVLRYPPPWFLTQSYGGSIVPMVILAPILLREVISILWVLSDVLIIICTSSSGIATTFVQKGLSICHSLLDSIMSLLIKPDRWRQMDSFQRQRTLAKIVSQCSLVMELGIGAVLIGDAIQSFWRFTFLSPNVAITSGGIVTSTNRIPFKCVLGKIVCAHLYMNFLISRKKNIQVLVDSMQGGAVLDRMLDILIDPMKEMGLTGDQDGKGGY